LIFIRVFENIADPSLRLWAGASPEILVGGQATIKSQHLNISCPLILKHHPQNVPFSGACFSE